MENVNIWRITPKTNLHVGNENTSSYGIIDLAVQRDALTNLPCINSSSLKGAIREFAISEGKLSEGKLSDENLIKIFGSDSEKKNSQKGGCVFFDAQIVAIPKQTTGAENYKLVTCKAVVDAFVKKAELFGIEGFAIQEYENEKDEMFNELCDDYNLPIIARNTIENGTSANLWYEQVIPAETVFYTFIKDESGLVKQLLDNKIVQVGANATIGYGYCEFKLIK